MLLSISTVICRHQVFKHAICILEKSQEILIQIHISSVNFFSPACWQQALDFFFFLFSPFTGDNLPKSITSSAIQKPNSLIWAQKTY